MRTCVLIIGFLAVPGVIGAAPAAAACYAARTFAQHGEAGWLVRNECGYTLGVRWCASGTAELGHVDSSLEIGPGRMLWIVLPFPRDATRATGLSVCAGPFCLPAEPGCGP